VPKEGAKLRPIGIPTIEDKIVQAAVARILSAVYEHQPLPPGAQKVRPKAPQAAVIPRHPVVVIVSTEDAAEILPLDRHSEMPVVHGPPPDCLQAVAAGRLVASQRGVGSQRGVALISIHFYGQIHTRLSGERL
jgi:hypothetical protein